MADMNVMGRNGNSSGKMNYQSNNDTDADMGTVSGSRNGRKGKNQIHEKGNTDNGNSGENMLNAGSLETPTNVVRRQVEGQEGDESIESTKGKSSSIESHNTTSPELAKP